MKKYIKNSVAVSEKCSLTTPYGKYEFHNEEEMQEFLDYVNADPDYNDPDLGDIIEWSYFYKKDNSLL